MPTSSVRVLVVDNYEPFRRFVCSTLKQRPDLQIIGETSDGLEAVQKAEELQPDLIVLDLGLPTLTGIEAARRIRKLSPESKILVVSQESSVGVVQEALRSGALGYVVKIHAGIELLDAVEAVRQGRQYLSSGLSGHNFTDATASQAPDGLCRNEVVASPAPALPRTAESTRRHEAEFYSDDGSFLDGFTQFIVAALKSGHAVIVVATELHRDSLLPRLQAHGLDIGAEIEQGRYMSLDAAETLSTFMANDLPEPVRFMQVVGDLIMAAVRAAKGGRPRVAACGECAPLLWAQGNAEAAIRVEHFWDEIAKIYDVDVLCGYQWTSFDREEDSHVLQRICAEHSAVHSP